MCLKQKLSKFIMRSFIETIAFGKGCFVKVTEASLNIGATR